VVAPLGAPPPCRAEARRAAGARETRKIRRRPARGNDHARPEIMALQQSNPKKSTAHGRRPRAPEWGPHSPSCESRLKAAGLGEDDEPPADTDAMRNALRRRIYMFINNWRGCPEPACRRQRGCMAPKIVCTNAPAVKTTPEQTARTMALVYRTVRELADKHAAEEG
jgi:hypothetical protein